MDKKEIFKGESIFGGIVQCDNGHSEFDVFRRKEEKLKTEMLSTRSCYDYVLNEIEKENQNIDNLMKYNQKRITLLMDLGKRLENLNNKLEETYKDMFEYMIMDINNINNINNNINNVNNKINKK